MGKVRYEIIIEVLKKLTYADQMLIRWMHESSFYLAAKDVLDEMDENNPISVSQAYLKCGLLLAPYDKKGSQYYLATAYDLAKGLDDDLAEMISFMLNIEYNSLYKRMSDIISSANILKDRMIYKLDSVLSDKSADIVSELFDDKNCELILLKHHNIVLELFDADNLKRLDFLLPSDSLLRNVIKYMLDEFNYYINKGYVFDYDTNSVKECEVVETLYTMSKYYDIKECECYLLFKASALYNDKKYKESVELFEYAFSIIAEDEAKHLLYNYDYIRACSELMKPMKAYEHFKYLLTLKTKPVEMGMIYIPMLECLVNNYEPDFLDIINRLINDYEKMNEEGLFVREMEYEPEYYISKIRKKLDEKI